MEEIFNSNHNKWIIDDNRNEFYENDIPCFNTCCCRCGISWEYLIHCPHPKKELIINAKVVIIPNEHISKVLLVTNSKLNKGILYLCIGCLKGINRTLTKNNEISLPIYFTSKNKIQ